MTGRDEDCIRITDLSFLDAEDVKHRNTKFLEDDDHPYETGLDIPKSELRADIWRVRNGDIRTVLRQFPLDESLPVQCALWVHAIAGIHFFPDANHRTAIALLRKLLQENDISYREWSPDRIRSVRERSHTIRAQIDDIDLDSMYRRDALYDLWRDFFTGELEVWTTESG